MPVKRSVLFVCTGNTCRSPMAEGLFRHASAHHPEWSVASAGLAAVEGASASHETLKSLSRKGIDLSEHQSRQLTKEMVDEATDIFVMTSSHLAVILANMPEAAPKVHLVTEYTTKRDIEDPIGYGQDVYDQVSSTLEEAIKAIIVRWENQ